MKENINQDFNDFFSGHIIVNKDRKIIFCNVYMCDLSGHPNANLLGTPISQYFTKASTIFIDSYIYPLLINQSYVQEMQMTWLGKSGKKIPIVVNIKLGADGLSYWSLYVCETRDKLQDELLKANEKLEAQSQELFRLATTDPLTGLLNRRELQAQAQKIAHRAERKSSTFALFAIDVDFFKQVNDTHGHQTGDKVLIHLANTLSKERRKNDLVARVGGEEFVLLLPDIDEENAFLLAEKIRTLIGKQSIENIKITVSIGLVVTRQNTQTDFYTLLTLSDKALYEAKNAGRNRTHIAQH
ncbi:sensor domain-containing diguanylate cyclase [Marinomonas transparens]|uniref:diguanylate cyclase n=1 Tax=Marinomonas transparens TaxID=2795388 RepID=A0A934JY58_9GAMM|nr:GGDEF domain-containing protein [Marinomonas transparens]MBJ7539097.1 GGDEF domain-containing protein [Marinomonas transparens]